VDQVDAGVAVGGGFLQGCGVESIAADHFDTVSPGKVIEFVGMTRQAAHIVTGPQQVGHEPPSYVSGCSGDENSHRRASVGRRRGYLVEVLSGEQRNSMRIGASRRRAERGRVCHVVHDLRRGGTEHLLVYLAGAAATTGIETSVVRMMLTAGHAYDDELRRAGVLHGMIGQTVAYHRSADHL